MRAFQAEDEDAVVRLWTESGLVVPQNDPHRDIARKGRVQADGFLVACVGGAVVGTVMVGYGGHRGWINYLAVSPAHRRRGIGRTLVAAAEAWLRAAGCPKLNLQVRCGNAAALAFYQRIGFVEDEAVSLGKRLESDT